MPIDKLSANAFATGAVANSLGYTPANKAGDTFTGTVTANTLVVSTNTATFGTSAYHVANGFVGINGMSVPGYPLDVAGGSLGIRSVYGYESGTFINLRPEAANGVAVIGFGARSGNAPDLVFKRDDGTEVVRIMNSGGIKFPSTQIASSDANSLDDYEEGSWTPNVIHSSSNNSTWTQKNGRYIKVGGIVTCWFVCDAGNSGTAGSVLQVVGIPFTPVSIPNGCSTGIWGTNSTTPQVTGNIFNDGGTQRFFYGGNQISTQASYASGMFTYQAA